MQIETLRASAAITRKVHHSAATLARWKVGAAAWSKAHSGRVYRGHPPAQTTIAGKAPRYACRDIAVEPSTLWPMLLTEPLPEFSAYASGAQPSETAVLDLVAASNVPAERDELLGGSQGYSGSSGVGGGASSSGGGSANGSAGAASLPPAGPEATPPRSRLAAPEHPAQEVTLPPGPLPAPAIVPTPEPSGVILLATGVVALAVCKFRKQSAF